MAAGENSDATAAARAARVFPQDKGRLFEDFIVGDSYRHWPGRTILDADNTWFTLLTMNTHPLHFDRQYSAGADFGGVLVNSLLTLSIVTGMSVRDTSQRAVANLGWTEVRLPAPVFVGDTLYAESEVVSARRSASRPGQGIVGIRTCGYKFDGNAHPGGEQKKTVVVEFGRSFLIACRNGAA
jgi:acyl dehydratase